MTELRIDPRSLTNAGLATELRREARQAIPGEVRRDWIIAPLLMEACARLVMAPPRDPLGSARDEARVAPVVAPEHYAVLATAGSGLIAIERSRQVSSEGYDDDHDDEHDEGQLAWAAVCYAAPESVYRLARHRQNNAQEFKFAMVDPWPWSKQFDKRVLADITPDERVRELVKAGVLIAAEIDRIQRIHPASLSATCSVECNGWDRPQGPGHARECPNWRSA